MKPFNLELAKQGCPICTRDGHNARIICFNKKGEHYPIVALVLHDYEEVVYTYTSEGRYYYDSDSSSDLMMASVKREGWVNVYDNNKISNIFDTKEMALSCRSSNGYVTTIKIEWEE